MELEGFDERILESGAFVDELKKDYALRDKMKHAVTLNRLLAIVSGQWQA